MTFEIFCFREKSASNQISSKKEAPGNKEKKKTKLYILIREAIVWEVGGFAQGFLSSTSSETR